ncbi:hypothetical protein CWE13_11225 [Aliidiomarina shirensis]|uniref:Teneurin-like YD-shell domain-containing protein n=1 Tax=Aliidiomarina shirensis TaxID=1048642 RepID=A0A432WNY3_9GAMM|nr:hypothetical protein [Aliidiomarina shirensis]RUO35494.1 hypothetical protein CWE13_11225 [Aliidiomarina shirensis]
MSEALSVDGQQFNFASHYNTLGHLTTHVYPSPSGRVVNYAPNGYGEATQSGGYANNVSYAPSGQLESFDYANGLSFNQTLDSQRRPELCTISDVQALFSHSYQYDDNHNITSIIDGVISENSMTMSYDGLDRLDTASGFWGSGSFDYDVLGNITQKTLGNETLTYHYSNNRLTSVSGILNRSFNYDTRGNVINNRARSFTFNRAGRLHRQ